MLKIVLKARISTNTGILTDLELNYCFRGLRCFQTIPYKALDGFINNRPTLDTSQIMLVEGFSIKVDTNPTAIAFNEIQLKHHSDDSLNFNLPMGLVTEISISDGAINFHFV